MSSSVALHARTAVPEAPSRNPLPQLVQTPSGLALLELQGTINLPELDENGGETGDQDIQIGRLSFPDFHPEAQDAAWMGQVHLYVGHHQRFTGEMKKLPKAIAIIRKRPRSGQDAEMAGSVSENTKDDLELVEIVKYKLMFSHRPEPVGGI
ncbi:putative sister chromatid cohesion protein Ctf8 [Nemania serpens]|nr:putative sister chromatid cohesion protein Ctf8 [Nemania serpens]